MSNSSPSVTPAHGSPVTFRTVFPQASRLERRNHVDRDVLVDLRVFERALLALAAGWLCGKRRGRLHCGTLLVNRAPCCLPGRQSREYNRLNPGAFSAFCRSSLILAPQIG